MFNQNNEPTNYSTYDSTSSNPYIYNNKLNADMPPYQQQQNMYYFIRQLNPITSVTLSPQTLDPTNLPCDYRPTYYNTLGDAWGIDSMNDVMHNRTPQNNPNNWRDNIPNKQGYYNQNEHTNNYFRPQSAIKLGQATSNQDYNGYLLF
jgi:hypothetical protein